MVEDCLALLGQNLPESEKRERHPPAFAQEVKRISEAAGRRTS